MACQYRQTFEQTEDISEHVLWPTSPSERKGMEDARFVRFTEPDGTVDYRATYTANSGTDRVQLLRTPEFRTFRTSQVLGDGAGHKDLALFPRQAAGRYLALSRFDREHNAVAVSDDRSVWGEPTLLHVPVRP
jgi:predicted GH43/DUF377 family glycosyl hydrolase